MKTSKRLKNYEVTTANLTPRDTKTIPYWFSVYVEKGISLTEVDYKP